MNKKLLITVVGAALATAGVPALAVDAKISGQLNRAIMYADDGKATETHYVDNSISSSRFRFLGSEDIGGGIKAGINWEMEFQSNRSQTVTQASRSDAGGLAERIQEVYFTGAFGTLGLGQGPGAADGGAEVDLSGTGVVSGALSYLLGGGIAFRTSTETGPTGSGPTIGSVIADQDFESRYDRLRYNSPKFGPAQINVSRGVSGGNDVNEASVWISADLGGAGKLAAAVGYSDEDKNSSADNETTIGGSVSYLTSFGLNVTAGYTNVEDDAPGTAAKDAKWTMLKVGYIAGPHAVSVMMAKGDDQAATNDEADQLSLGYVFTATKAVEIYAGLQKFSLDRPGTDFEDITIGALGSRVKF